MSSVFIPPGLVQAQEQATQAQDAASSRLYVERHHRPEILQIESEITGNATLVPRRVPWQPGAIVAARCYNSNVGVIGGTFSWDIQWVDAANVFHSIWTAPKAHPGGNGIYEFASNAANVIVDPRRGAADPSSCQSVVVIITNYVAPAWASVMFEIIIENL